MTDETEVTIPAWLRDAIGDTLEVAADIGVAFLEEYAWHDHEQREIGPDEWKARCKSLILRLGER